jgi:23S rRNA (uracil1939-C5)-methyltransferase
VQVNQDMNQRMLHQAIGLLQPLAGERVLDLFCGIGNFSLPLARHGAEVTGVELDGVMVAKAISNAAANGLDNVNFVTGDLMQPDQEQSFWRQSFDTVVLDPPRAGARDVLERIAATGAKRILYVSCHAGSLARDAGILVAEYGYRLQNAGAMDMFPQTSHVEAMALFVLRDA